MKSFITHILKRQPMRRTQRNHQSSISICNKQLFESLKSYIFYSKKGQIFLYQTFQKTYIYLDMLDLVFGASYGRKMLKLSVFGFFVIIIIIN